MLFNELCWTGYIFQKCLIPQFVNKRMENGEISLNGDGDGHEDARAEEDVVEGEEEVGEEVVMQSSYGAISGDLRLKVPPGVLYDTEDEEQEVKHRQSEE